MITPPNALRLVTPSSQYLWGVFYYSTPGIEDLRVSGTSAELRLLPRRAAVASKLGVCVRDRTIGVPVRCRTQGEVIASNDRPCSSRTAVDTIKALP